MNVRLMFPGLLKTKLYVPTSRPNQVARPALLEKLRAARQAGATFALVSAPAGFGKTSLVADWVRACGLPCAWLTLDSTDNDPQHFWRYVDAAFQGIDSRIGESLRPALSSAQAPVLEQVITGMVNDILQLGQEFILVLEDYHVIEQAAIHESLNFLLDHLPPQIQLIVTTRSDPALSLARRRGRGQLVEIRAADLRFSTAEIGEFLNHHLHLDLPGEDILALHARTEGWAAGLQMVALSLQDEADRHAFVTAFSGDDHYIADYLMEEVLQRQPVEFQQFLLQTAILDRLSAGVCDAVSGRQDSRAVLNLLERANLFILPLDNRREWFRYHHLFGELLQKRLRETVSPAELARLHLLAADWCEQQGEINAAIRHVRAIPDEQRLLRLLETNAPRFFGSGEVPQFYELACTLPPGLRARSIQLCGAAAWAGLASGHYAEIPAWLEAIEASCGMAAEAALQTPARELDCALSLLEVLVIRLQFPSGRSAAGQREHVLAIQAQLNALPQDKIVLFSSVRDLNAVIAFNLGLLAEDRGDLAEATQAYLSSLTLARQTQNSNLFSLSSAHLANIQLAQGQLRAARRTHEQTLAESSRMVNWSPYHALAHAGLGGLQYEWNDLAAAEDSFRQCAELAHLWNQWESLYLLALGQARLRLGGGDRPAALQILAGLESPPLAGMDLPLRAYAARMMDSDAAAAWLSAAIGSNLPEPNPNNENCLLDIARVLDNLGRREESLALLDAILRFAADGGRKHTQIRARVAQAVIAGRPEALCAALQLAAPEGYVSTFLEEGAALGSQLRHLLRLGQLDGETARYAQKLLCAFEPASPPPASPAGLREPLSERELEVLRHMAEGLSNPEIAARLYLSPNTLKAHAQNIFAKLEVHNRLQAVSRARELNLL